MQEGCHVEVKAKIGVTELQVKECQGSKTRS